VKRSDIWELILQLKEEGSYNNLLRGIPLEEIIEMLLELGYKD